MELPRHVARGVAAILAAVSTGAWAADPPAIPPLRVVSYNIRHGAGMDGRVDLGRTAAVLRRLAPDLVALQEVDERCRRSGGVEQAAELGRLLGMEHRFGTFMDHDGGRYGLAVLSRLPVREARRHELPRGAEPRCALEVEVEVPGLAGPLSFTCVHNDWTQEALRVAQVRALLEALGAGDRLAVLIGDFNGEPGSDSLALLAAAGWTVVAKDGPPESRQTWPSDAPAREIDHVAVRGLPPFTVEHRVIDERDASDHRPLAATFTFAPGAAAGHAAADEAARRKIAFDLEALDAEGLAGPADGKVAVSYEFRIPDTAAARAAVLAIDPDIEITTGSRGRVDAGPGFALCIGSTHRPRHREILLALARLACVERIARCHFE